MSLTGKRIVVIGGSSGIGLAVAKSTVAAGARVVIASRSQEKLEKARIGIGEKAEALTLDVSVESEVKAFFEKVTAFDHLVITAVTSAMGPFLEIDSSSARSVFESKFWGQYYAARYGAPKIGKAGSITFFSGVASRRPVPGLSAVAAVNGAVEGLARSLALELAPIRVNAVSPGLTGTPRYDPMPEEKRRVYFETTASKLPVKRIGKAEDIAGAVVYLMENEFTTGTVVEVNGGALII